MIIHMGISRQVNLSKYKNTQFSLKGKPNSAKLSSSEIPKTDPQAQTKKKRNH